ncbi:MAG: hypothetical protein ITG02_12475 [Patulibacter sp.]|nr:hypothetical protein [Patulibacter sp.]
MSRSAPTSAKRWPIGQVVFCPGRGMGTIVGRDARRPLQTACTYLTIRYEHPAKTVLVPEDRAGELGVRRPAGEPEVKRALAVLSTPPSCTRDGWQPRLADNTAKLRSGDLCAIAEVLRDLTNRAADSALRMQERSQRLQAFNSLQGQLRHALTLHDDEARKILTELLPAVTVPQV